MRKLLLLLLLLAQSAGAYPYKMGAPSQVTVTTTATVVASGVGWDFAEVCNVSTSATLYLGFAASLTSANGRPVQPGTCVIFAHLQQGQTIYGIASSGTIDARVTKALET